MAKSWEGLSAEDKRIIKDEIAGLKPVPTRGKEFEKLSPYQLTRIVNLRKIIVQYRVPTNEHGKFGFTLDTLKALDVFIGGESNQVQKVAYRNRIQKIKDDLTILRTMQDDLDELIQDGASESSIDVARDEIEDLGRETARAYVGLINILQADILEAKGLAASSMYRASLTNERQMYAMLERDGSKLRRKWNDVLLEVRNLLSATNHDAKAKTNLLRMQRDLETILRYLDEYALLPFLAPRDVVASIVLINRRLNDYQDEYDLSQSDTERIATVIDDRQTRDERRAWMAEKSMNFLNALGVSKNMSVGGLVRGTMAVGRGLHTTVRFLTRTAPNLLRSGWTALRTTPQRIGQTFRQLGSAVLGAGRAIARAGGTLLGKKYGSRGGINWNDPLSQQELSDTISRGYKSDGSISAPVLASGLGDESLPISAPVMASGLGDESLPVGGSLDESTVLTPEGARAHSEAVESTARTPGSTSSLGSSTRKSDTSSLSHRLDVVDFKLDLILKGINSGRGPTDAGVRDTTSEYGELESLRRSEELDLLKSISTSLERVASRMGDGDTKSKGGIFSAIVQKYLSMKNWMNNALQALGAWKLISKGISFVKGTLAVLSRVAGPLLRLGGVVGRILLGPVGALLGAGTAGWAIGKAVYEKYNQEIGDIVDASVGFVKDSVNKVYAIVHGFKNEWDEWRGKGKEKVEQRKARSVANAVAANMRDSKGLSPETVAMAKAAGIDVSMYPTWDPKTGKITPPTSAPPTPSITNSSPATTQPSPSAPSIVPSSPPSSSSAPPISRSHPYGVVQEYAVSVGTRSVSNSSITSPNPSSPVTSVYGDSAAPVSAVSGNLYRAASDANMDGLQPHVRSNFEAMVAEYKQRGGKFPVSVNRAFASYEQQAALFKKYGPGRAARPGRSAHNFGVAIDIDSPAANEMAKMGLLDKYGFDRPVKGEPWHLQVKGVSAAMARQGIYSADAPVDQGAPAEATAKREASRSAPSVLASADRDALPSGEMKPVTSVRREEGLSPEAAAYSSTPSAKVMSDTGSSKKGDVPGMQAASPSGHGTARIPEFSFGDPTFFALNLGALAS